MGNRPGYLTIENLKRDTRQLREVWKTEDGRPPAEPDPEIPSFQLHLGSADDNNDDVREHNRLAAEHNQSAGTRKKRDLIPEPVQEIPRWALKHYRDVPLFRHWENTGEVRVSSAA